MHALEVGNFWLISGGYERVEPSFNEFAHAAAEHGLLAEEVGLGFLGERRFENARACATETLGVGKCERPGIARCVLLDRDEGGSSATFGENFADAMSRRFGSDHRDIHI